jgi:hypothetical protein
MGLFDWLFKKPKVAQQREESIRVPSQTIELSKPFMSVDSIGYAGLYSLSKSKNWAISWRDSDPAAGRGGHRENGFGEYVLAI